MPAPEELAAILARARRAAVGGGREGRPLGTGARAIIAEIDETVLPRALMLSAGGAGMRVEARNRRLVALSDAETGDEVRGASAEDFAARLAAFAAQGPITVRPAPSKLPPSVVDEGVSPAALNAALPEDARAWEPPEDAERPAAPPTDTEEAQSGAAPPPPEPELESEPGHEPAPAAVSEQAETDPAPPDDPPDAPEPVAPHAGSRMPVEARHPTAPIDHEGFLAACADMALGSLHLNAMGDIEESTPGLIEAMALARPLSSQVENGDGDSAFPAPRLVIMSNHAAGTPAFCIAVDAEGVSALSAEREDAAAVALAWTGQAQPN
jgi:hypothetical protein